MAYFEQETRKGWHDECAHVVFAVDTSKADWGQWHWGTGKIWCPWREGVRCDRCGEEC